MADLTSSPFTGVCDVGGYGEMLKGSSSSFEFMDMLEISDNYNPFLFDPFQPQPDMQLLSPASLSEVVNTPATPIHPASNYEAPKERSIDEEGEREEEKNQEKTEKQFQPKKKKQKREREPRFAFMTKSDVDHLDDGYRWRKYGQKAVKNSPYPRNYYRCTFTSCGVKKRVERSSDTPSIIITTYEGTHTHPCPVTPRGINIGMFPGTATSTFGAGVRVNCSSFVIPQPEAIKPYFENNPVSDLPLVPSLNNYQPIKPHSCTIPSIVSIPTHDQDLRFCPSTLMVTDQGLLQDMIVNAHHRWTESSKDEA